jgi:rare lipoprotein A
VWLKTFIVCGFLSMTPSIVHGNGLQNNVGAKVSGKVFQTGKASYYGGKHAGRKTFSGSIFNPNDLTAAHNSLPMGTIVEVRCVATRKTVIVKITDTGGFAKYGRIIDLSQHAANLIGINQKNGIATVEIKILKKA